MATVSKIANRAGYKPAPTDIGRCRGQIETGQGRLTWRPASPRYSRFLGMTGLLPPYTFAFRLCIPVAPLGRLPRCSSI